MASQGAPRRSFATVPQAQNSQPAATARGDPYHGQEEIAKLASKFITHLFACPDYPPSAAQNHARLPYFIAYALHRTKLHVAVTFAALVLLQRLKARFPSARGSSGHRLFISAYMISSKVMCDDTYSNKSWAIVAQGMFTLREVNQMEREMCGYLDWELTVDEPILGNFEVAVRRDFARDRVAPFPNYPNTFVSKRAARRASEGATATASPTQRDSNSANGSPVPFKDSPRRRDGNTTPSRSGSGSSPWAMATTPDTPSPSTSNASPTSSASPATPLGPETNPKIRGPEGSPAFGLTADSGGNPRNLKCFGFAVPTGW